MKIAELTGKNVAILGFGIEGQESVEFLLRHQSKITVFDEKDESDFDKARIAFLKNEGVTFRFGAFDSLQNFDVVLRSPGIKPGIKALHEAGDLGIPITSGTSVFLENAKGTTIGVTGTKGKGTTCALLYQMLKDSGKDVYLGGNIGVPALSFLHKLTDTSITILELSSFQLMDVTRSPHIAVILMVTQDHMDYHAHLAEYVQAKIGIVKFQTTEDYVIANADYDASLRIAEESRGKKLFVSLDKCLPEGSCIKDDAVAVTFNGNGESIIPAREILLPGRHNLENVCSAALAARLVGADRAAIAETLKTFKGLEHRLELVNEKNGVKYYNDSIATVPDSTIAAIKAFIAPEVLILGGSSKNGDFTALGDTISKAQNIKAIIGIGEEWQKIKAKIRSEDIEFVEELKSMGEIVQRASELAKPGDIVILSPACASFDMFKDYKDRGDQFKKAVDSL